MKCDVQAALDDEEFNLDSGAGDDDLAAEESAAPVVSEPVADEVEVASSSGLVAEPVLQSPQRTGSEPAVAVAVPIMAPLTTAPATTVSAAPTKAVTPVVSETDTTPAESVSAASADKKLQRAARFGIPLSQAATEEQKKQKRGERFGIAPKVVSEGAVSSHSQADLEKIKMRSERFGAISEAALAVEQEKAKKEGEAKKAVRAQRFSLGASVAEMEAEQEK